jgi:peptidyl-prolyl isomerase G (cyclophilin G)
VHRIIEEFMVQGGDIERGDGTGVASIYGGEYEDESLGWRDIDEPGLLCSANRGPDSNGSQFFITIDNCTHLKSKHTVFGRMISGQETLEKITNVAVDTNDKPLQPVLISRCGELEKKGKQKQKQPVVKDSAVSTDSRDRGRRRRSGSDVDMSASPQPRPVQRNRRQSDNIIDEGLRGRPRQRSTSHSPSQAIEESSESEPESATEIHKRKRSQSPSRHNADPTPHNDETSDGQRRRRSLPNQYAEDRARRTYGEEDRYRPSPRRDNTHYAGRRDDRPRQRQDDRYRPRNDRFNDDGRLDGGRLDNDGVGGENDPPVKYKGRGSMKYREPGRL